VKLPIGESDKYPYQCYSCGHEWYEQPLNNLKWFGYSWFHPCPKCGKEGHERPITDMILVKGKPVKIRKFFFDSSQTFVAAKDASVETVFFRCVEIEVH